MGPGRFELQIILPRMSQSMTAPVFQKPANQAHNNRMAMAGFEPAMIFIKSPFEGNAVPVTGMTPSYFRVYQFRHIAAAGRGGAEPPTRTLLSASRT